MKKVLAIAFLGLAINLSLAGASRADDGRGWHHEGGDRVAWVAGSALLGGLIGGMIAQQGYLQPGPVIVAPPPVPVPVQPAYVYPSPTYAYPQAGYAVPQPLYVQPAYPAPYPYYRSDDDDDD